MSWLGRGSRNDESEFTTAPASTSEPVTTDNPATMNDSETTVDEEQSRAEHQACRGRQLDAALDELAMTPDERRRRAELLALPLEERLRRAEMLAELRKNFLLEFSRQLAVKHVPLTKVLEIIDAVRTSATSNFHALKWRAHGLDPSELTKDLWGLESYFLLALDKKPEPSSPPRSKRSTKSAETTVETEAPRAPDPDPH